MTILTSHISTEGDAVASSVCPFVSTLFLNGLTFDLDFLHVCKGYDQLTIACMGLKVFMVKGLIAVGATLSKGMQF